MAQLYAAPRVQNEHLHMTCTLVHACALASCAHVLCWVGPAAYARLVVELRGRVVVGLGGSGGDRALCLSGLWCTLWVVYALAHTVLGPPSPLSFPLLGAMAANVFPARTSCDLAGWAVVSSPSGLLARSTTSSCSLVLRGFSRQLMCGHRTLGNDSNPHGRLRPPQDHLPF